MKKNATITTLTLALTFSTVLMTSAFPADGKVSGSKWGFLSKKSDVAATVDRKSGIMDGNLILTLFYNFGGIGNWSIAGRLNSGIYPKGSGRSYFAEFTPVIGAECYNANGLPTHIFSDGIVVDSRNQMDKDENGRQLGFDPLSGYANPLQDKIAMSDDPESWPDTWPGKDNTWSGYWNGQYGKYVRGDLETYFAMSDVGNDEFPFYPYNDDVYSHLTGNLVVLDVATKSMALIDDVGFNASLIKTIGKKDVLKIYNGTAEKDADFYEIVKVGKANGNVLSDTLYLKGSFPTSDIRNKPCVEYSIMKGAKRGLGFEVDVRGYQWSHPAAEDLIIWTYWINNISDYSYEKTVFAMYGDADVGDDGDQHDDMAWFDRPNSIVYQWDKDMWSAVKGGFKPAYFGWRFLESPGNPIDGIDNDYDGLIDESQFDGIDNDGDWDPSVDDKGSDGIGPNDESYPGADADGTERNGIPDSGEPNFEYTDNHESDQIGLTSFSAGPWPAILCSNDEVLWGQAMPDFFGQIYADVDLTFLYGSGHFSLPSVKVDPINSRRKFSVAMVLGADQKDIFRNATVIQQIYNADYAFAKPPRKPKVTAVPGNNKVTLYWDRTAENSIDHIYGKDFEGYRIYKSTDPNFLETRLISDAYGNLTFNKPLVQFDIQNGLYGLHPIDYNGVKFDMGEDTGLQYSYIDTDVQNGQTYYYAVCSYDKGYYEGFYSEGWSAIDSLPPMQPSECSKRLFTNVSGQVTATDDNTVVVVPNAPAAGYVPPEVTDVDSTKFIATGTVNVDFVDPLLIKDDAVYEIRFKDTMTDSIDNDNDWVPWEDKPDKIYNLGERFLDYGTDKIADSLESGFHPQYNPDPVHDNYNKYTNMCDRFDNDGDNLIDSLDFKYVTIPRYIINNTTTPPETTVVYDSTKVYDDWGTENNEKIDWIDKNGDGVYQNTETGEVFYDVGNGIWDTGEKLKHDLGADGLGPSNAGYPGVDAGEGDGLPTIGEPNLDYRDSEEMARTTTTYTMFDMTDPNNPDTLIKNSPWINGEVYNDFTRGMHIRVKTATNGVISQISGWTNPQNLFTHTTKVYTEGGGGVPYPHDYQMIVTDSIQFKSYNNKPSNFFVLDKTTGDTSKFVYLPKYSTGLLSLGDKIVPLIPNYDINTAGTVKGTWLIEMQSKLPNIVQILKDSKGKLWALSADTMGTLAYYSDSTWNEVFARGLSSLNITCFDEYVNGTLWLGTDDGIYTFDGKTVATAPIDTFAMGNRIIKTILVDKNGSVWIGSGGGITHYMGSENIEFFAQSDSVFQSYDITCLYQASDNSVWAGTADGAIKFTRSSPEIIPASSLPNKSVTAIYEDNLGLLVGTADGFGVLPSGSSVWNKVTGSLLVTKKVNCFLDLGDSLWVGSDKGISIMKTNVIPTAAAEIRKISITGKLIRSEVVRSFFYDGTTMFIGNKQGFDIYRNGKWDSFAPHPGDIFTLITSKPFTSEDVFVFKTNAAAIDSKKAKDEMKKIAVVPNPYIVAASWEPAHLYTSGRGIRKLDFIHLPKKCEIKIFTIRGYLVKTLQHDSSIDDGSESWDLTSKDGLDVAYGLYIYHVDAPGVGTKVGKFAVIK